jgi:hypothetical protein
MIDSSLINGYPLIKVEYNYYIENLLLGRGFTTKDSYKKLLMPTVGKRSYSDLQLDTLVIYQINQEETKDSSTLISILNDSKKSTFILYSGHYGIPARLKIY